MLKRIGKRGRLVAAGLVGAASLAAGVLVFGREKPPELQTAEVRRGDLEVSISAAGKVQPKFYVDVGAQVSGQLERVLVEVGEQVEKGQLLAEIDETVAAARVEADRASLMELEAQIAQQTASLELSRANFARADMLFKADAISQAEHQAARADLRIAEGRIAQLNAQKLRQNSTLEADLASLSFTKIYAPMSGTVVSQAAVEGQTLNANQTTPTIMRIADLSLMTVEADVSEADVLRVRAGQEAYFTTLGSASDRWRTTVRQVLPQPEVVNDVVLYKVLLDIENADEALKPEMTAQVFFVTGRARDAVLVPVAALSDGPRGAGRRGDGERPAREGRPQRQPGAQANAGGSRGGVLAAQAAESGGRGDGARQGRRAALNGSVAADFEQLRAARPDGEVKIARVMTKDGPVPRMVLIGISSRAEAEVIAGLEPGETVVTGEAVAAPPNRTQAQGPMGPGGGMGRRGPR